MVEDEFADNGGLRSLTVGITFAVASSSILVLFRQNVSIRLRNCLLFCVKHFWRVLGVGALQLGYPADSWVERKGFFDDDMINQELYELIARFDGSGLQTLRLPQGDFTIELGRDGAPDRPPFVSARDKVKQGAPVCILEAMKTIVEVPVPCDCVIDRGGPRLRPAPWTLPRKT